MISFTLVTSQLHFEMCAGLYGHPVLSVSKHYLKVYYDAQHTFE